MWFSDFLTGTRFHFQQKFDIMWLAQINVASVQNMIIKMLIVCHVKNTNLGRMGKYFLFLHPGQFFSITFFNEKFHKIDTSMRQTIQFCPRRLLSWSKFSKADIPSSEHYFRSCLVTLAELTFIKRTLIDIFCLCALFLQQL